MARLTSRVASLTALASFATALGLAGCERQTPAQTTAAPPPVAVQATAPATDVYDTSKMDFKPGPAALSAEPHKGAFAAGDALSIDATLKPLAPNPVKEVRLDTTHKIIEIAPGVNFSAWTFGDQVPGPSCARASAIASSSR